MGRISIVDLEVNCHVGVSDEERAQAQRLLISVVMEYDFSSAAVSDRLTKTIDYFDVTQRLLKLGDGRSWRLIEKLCTEIADLILDEYPAQSVMVEVKKFSIPQARHVSVGLIKSRTTAAPAKRSAWGIP
jgi:FolB domain-containing protein